MMGGLNLFAVLITPSLRKLVYESLLLTRKFKLVVLSRLTLNLP